MTFDEYGSQLAVSQQMKGVFTAGAALACGGVERRIRRNTWVAPENEM